MCIIHQQISQFLCIMLKNNAEDVKMMRDANYIYIQLGKIKKGLKSFDFKSFFSGIRTCILCMQNLGVRNASHCSAERFFESFLQRKKQAPFGTCFFFGSGIRIRTLNDGVRGSQSFFKTAYLSRFSDFASLKNLSGFYFCFE